MRSTAATNGRVTRVWNVHASSRDYTNKVIFLALNRVNGLPLKDGQVHPSIRV